MTDQAAEPTDEAVARARARAEGYDSAWHELHIEVSRLVQAVVDKQRNLAWLQTLLAGLAEGPGGAPDLDYCAPAPCGCPEGWLKDERTHRPGCTDEGEWWVEIDHSPHPSLDEHQRQWLEAYGA